ncbi:related to RTF1 - subunit of the RNA polymerase II-associated Paf1 complex [Melanopsichium pennsylvanicum]|uniref:Related to RTF1 - subunit of the RNA polymerase II-associated Paf1 complex n=2 Tax=Melanopsichium pennsylvanicum TaxID=63383 RepID=A0AAJ5C8E7_9BASI|nr:plus-3-domain-containing protein [Melanopsichium pennsylvanicum 4]SNX87493.1 related to RTF1 - subunit of the RNA polymerase II-associated Paf1 complex [Melanopsichium pennsylvanicum]
MAGGGLDDELLALAGGSARQIDMSSDEGDRVRAGSKRDSSSKAATSSSLAKKRRLDLLDESASGSDEDAAGSDDDLPSSNDGISSKRDPYPYQGIYKSARDMEELMSMNELEREDILARRRDEINLRRQKFELAALVKAQKAAAGATKKAATRKRVVRGGRRGDSDLSDSDDGEQDDADGDSDYGYGGGAAAAAKGRKKKLPGTTDAKSAKLNELKKKRKEKAAGGAGASKSFDSDEEASKPRRRGYASSSASDVSYSDYSDEEDHPRRHRAGPTTKVDRYASDTSEPPSLSDLKLARVTRDLIESRLYAPRWRQVIAGSFFRFSWGERTTADGRGEETIYRIHQVLDVVEKPGKFYDLSLDKSGKWCNVYLVFEHAGQECEAKITMLSRGEFSESERERWMAFLKGRKQRIPSKAEVIRKGEELDKFFSSPLTEADIGKILETKKRLRQEAMSVMGGSSTLSVTAGFDSPRDNKYDGTPGTPGMATSTNGMSGLSLAAQSLEAKLAAVNERNRAADRTKMSDVERKARSSKIAAAKADQQRNKARQNQQDQDNHNRDGGQDADSATGVELTNAKPGVGGMGNGFVAVKNYATLVEVDLGDF